jgi:hypothetical protein
VEEINFADMQSTGDISMTILSFMIINEIGTLMAKRANPQADTSKWEEEIDQLVYQLYGLTEDEVRIVEGISKR